MPGFTGGNTCARCAHVGSVGSKISAAIEQPPKSFLEFYFILGNRLATYPVKTEFPPVVSSLSAQSAHYDGIFFLVF
jgi:hypothetical protein